MNAERVDKLLEQVKKEVERQYSLWGDVDHPDGTGTHEQVLEAGWRKQDTRGAVSVGTLTWAHILREEVAEALAEKRGPKLKEELIQVAAVAVSWAEKVGES